MRVLPTVINLGEGLQPGTKQGRHAETGEEICIPQNANVCFNITQ